MNNMKVTRQVVEDHQIMILPADDTFFDHLTPDIARDKMVGFRKVRKGDRISGDYMTEGDGYIIMDDEDNNVYYVSFHPSKLA